MTNKKRLKDLENRKQAQLERLRFENEMTDYMTTYEYSMEIGIENKELLNSVINDILKF